MSPHSKAETQMASRRRENQGSTRILRSQAQCPTLHSPPPLATLPEELYREIFLHRLPTDEFILPTSTSAPLLLCQVCRAWRASAIATPDLWASISVGSDFGLLGRYPRVELIKLWLSRAKNRPLSISYGRYPPDNSELTKLLDDYVLDAAEETYEIFDSLICHIARWKSLRLCLDDIVGDCLPPIPPAGAPLLKQLSLALPPSIGSGYYEYDFSTSNQRIYEIWRDSPLLDTFTFLAEDVDFAEHADTLRTSLHVRRCQLTTLIITACQSIEQCLEILNQCPNLVDCAFHSVFIDMFEDTDVLAILYPTPILLPSLKSLFLRSSGLEGYGIFSDLLLSNTTMPVLRQLTLGNMDVLSSDLFSPFIGRSSCHIEDLTLNGVDIDDACLLQFLELLSHTLVQLCIRYNAPGVSPGFPVKCMSDTVMTRLTRDTSTSPATSAILCPKLESIDLDYCTVAAQRGLLSKMVSSRYCVGQYGITALKRVALRFSEEIPMDSLDVRALKELKEEGVIRDLSFERIGNVWDDE